MSDHFPHPDIETLAHLIQRTTWHLQMIPWHPEEGRKQALISAANALVKKGVGADLGDGDSPVTFFNLLQNHISEATPAASRFSLFSSGAKLRASDAAHRAGITRIVTDLLYDRPGFDEVALKSGKMQIDAFLDDRGNRDDLYHLMRMTAIIEAPYRFMVESEAHIADLTDIYRKFENNVIGHYYEWQQDSLDREDPEPSL